MTLHYEEQLHKIFANTNEWLKFAEAKNFGLITLNAAIVFGLMQINFEENSVAKYVSFNILSPLIYFSFFFSLLSFFPFLQKASKNSFWDLFDKKKKVKNIHFYGYLRKLNRTEFMAAFKSKTNSSEEFTEYEEELISQILYNSRITWVKLILFKIAGFFTLMGIVISPVTWLILIWLK